MLRKNEPYRAALYLRLSKDDGAGESGSITTQRSILTEYAQRSGLTVVAEFVDDGWSGTNYDRPGFQRMLADIEAGKIDCVLTKDLSRLGRNSARTADLLDEYFPSHGVRYIAVLDGYDSHALLRGTAMTASIMSVVNELYARDISEKIRSSLRAKMEQGEYIASFAPYGYQKDEQNRNHLVPDPQTAHIVRRIFRMAADGMPPGKIADALNESHIATPLVYRETGNAYAVDACVQKRWTSSMVCKLLARDVYRGHSVQGRTSKVSFKKNASRRMPQEAWITVTHTHEPIVTEAEFDRVRKRCVARRTPPVRGFENLFAGIVVCADCGKAMTTVVSRKNGATANLCCGGYKANGKSACSNHLIDYDLLRDTVVQELQELLTASESVLSELASEVRRASTMEDDAVQALAAHRSRQRELVRLQTRLYEDHALERIDTALYEHLSSAYRAEQDALLRRIAALEREQAAHTAAEPPATVDFTTIALTKPILQTFIERIEVGQGRYITDGDGKRRKEQSITIRYRFGVMP